MYLIDVLVDFFRIIMNIFITQRVVEAQGNNLKIFVKCGSETMVPVYLGKNWTVSDLKSDVASRLCLKPEDLRIIFAGKELLDSIILQDCDVGEQSIIHAVQQKRKQIDISVENKCSSSQTLFCPNECDATDQEIKKTSKSHFYIYCNDSCKGMFPGKLRVRCSTCKEGTLIVKQDPTCWDDVLIAGQIKGVCQEEGCEGDVAEFFFKCTNHVSKPNDPAVPLYLIKNNFKDIPCIACTDTSAIILVFPCSDGHVICLDCFRLYCLSRLNERRFIQDVTIGYSIDCPAGCSDSLIKEPHHFKLLGEQEYSRYQRFGAEECLLQAGGVLCPQPGCGAGILPDMDCPRIVCAQNSGGCGFVFCRECMQGFHIGACETTETAVVKDGINYSIIDERAASSKWDEDSRKVIRITTKPCPKCRTPTERDGGCMHMVCTRSQCGYHWCWVCQTEWTRDCMSNHWFG